MAWICPVVVFLVGATFAAIPILFALRLRGKASAIAGMPITRVEDLRSGVAKIKARVIAQDDLLTSPMERKLCVYYHFLVEEIRRTGGTDVRSGGGVSWDTVIDDKQGIDVVLEDKTGQVDVCLQDADVDLKSENSKMSGTFDKPPERLKKAMSRYGKSTAGLLFNKTLRYTETFLEDGAKVVVVGQVEKGRGNLRLVGGAIPLMVSDKGAKKMGSPYRRTEINCYVATGFIVVFFTFMTIVTGVFASKFSGDSAPPRNAGGPGAKQQQPGPDGKPVQENERPNPGAELDPFLADLRSPDVNQQQIAADKIRQIPVVAARRAEVRRELEAVLAQLNPATVVPALKALEKWGDKESVPLLLRMREPRDAPYHNQVYMTLGKIPDDHSASVLAASLGDKDESGLASAALRIMGPPAAEQALLRELQTSKDPELQALACATLGTVGTKASLPILERFTASKDVRVSALAKSSLMDIQERLAGR